MGAVVASTASWPVDVGREQAPDLLEEALGVDVAAPQEVDGAFHDQGQDDGQEERVDDEEGAADAEYFR
jgi:hypothetical protein